MHKAPKLGDGDVASGGERGRDAIIAFWGVREEEAQASGNVCCTSVYAASVRIVMSHPHESPFE